jgi:enoyl-CoA hydratase/carnithine racemase
METGFFKLDHERGCAVLQLQSTDAANKLTRACVASLRDIVQKLSAKAARSELTALIITGNEQFFSAGADLNEIARLTGPDAVEFSRLGQALMRAVNHFPVPVFAAIRGYCMGGGMDLALACDLRIAAPNAVFGHRGASLGVMTGWGGTQRLSRLIGKARAMRMFLLAEMVPADEALRTGLVDQVCDDPVEFAINRALVRQP